MVRTLSLWVVPPVLLSMQLACGGSEPTKPVAQDEAPAEAPAEPAVEAFGDKLDVSAFSSAGANATLVPSPRELQAALAAAGLQTTLANLVPARSWKLDANDPDRVAVRTGVIIADLLLTVKSSTDAELVGRLETIRSGMKTLEAGSDIDATIGDLLDRVKAGAVDRDALLAELDDLSQVAVPELEFNGQDRIVPLIKAGSWLAGANLVAKAAQTDAKPAAADGILKQPEVVAYFQGYVKAEEGKVPSEVANALDSSLAKLDEVSRKGGALADSDVQTVVDATHSVLELL